MLSLTIRTPEKTVFEGEISLLQAPGTVGYFEILPNHASMISSLQTGKLTVVLPDGQKKYYAISGGAFEINQNKALILGDTIEEASEIDFDRAKESYQKAFRILEVPPQDLFERRQANHALLRAKNRLDVYTQAKG